jgi:hypothetical protein
MVESCKKVPQEVLSTCWMMKRCKKASQDMAIALKRNKVKLLN